MTGIERLEQRSADGTDETTVPGGDGPINLFPSRRTRYQ